MHRAQNTKGKILKILAENSIVQRGYLTSIDGNIQTIYSALRELEEKQCITKEQKTISVKDTHQSVTFFQITTQGLVYLRNHAGKFSPAEKAKWLQEIDTTKTLDEKIYKGASGQKLLRFLEIANTAAYCNSINYQSRGVYVEDIEENEEYNRTDAENKTERVAANMWEQALNAGDSNTHTDKHNKSDKQSAYAGSKVSLKTIITTAKEKYSEQRTINEKKQRSNGTELTDVNATDVDIQGIYLNAYELKKKMQQEGIQDTRGRYVGIMENPLKSVLLYTSRSATKNVPLSIKRGELAQYYAYRARASKWGQGKLNEHDDAIIFVKNESDASKAYNSRKNYSINNITIIPTTHEGSESLRRYMNLDPKDMIGAGCTGEMLEAITNEYACKRIGWGAVKQYELEGEEGEKITVMPYLNMRKLEFVEEEYEAGNQFWIMAPQNLWSYISKIFPELEDRLIPM